MECAFIESTQVMFCEVLGALPNFRYILVIRLSIQIWSNNDIDDFEVDRMHSS